MLMSETWIDDGWESMMNVSKTNSASSAPSLWFTLHSRYCNPLILSTYTSTASTTLINE